MVGGETDKYSEQVREADGWIDIVLSFRGRRGLTVVACYSRINIDKTLHSCQLVPTVASLPLVGGWGG